MAATVLGLATVAAAITTGRAADALGSDPWRITAGSLMATLALGLVVTVVAAGLRSAPTPRAEPATIDARVVPVAVGVALGLALLPHVSTRAFDTLAREDNVAEWVSALAALAAAVIVASVAPREPLVVRVPMFVVAVAFFVMAGEELSWLQRILGYGSPAAFDASSQGETNLHNLATDRFQSAYYLGASVSLVLLPHLARWAPRTLGPLHGLVPGRTALVLAILSVPFTYARTGNGVHHLTVWIALAVLLLWDEAPRRAWTVGLIAVVVTAQALVVVAGPDLVRDWSAAEYREMFTGLALATWAAELLVRSRSGPGVLVAPRPAEAPRGR